MEIVISIVFILYLLLMLWLVAGWNRALVQKANSNAGDALVSVIIPVRNEENTLPLLLQDLLQQTHKNVEVIVVNDHSQDNTAVVAELLLTDITYRRLNPSWINLTETHGKKAAIAAGVEKAKGAVIITLDGDCRVGHQWIQSIMTVWDEHTSVMVGPVVLEADNFIGDLQKLEFFSLVASGAATIGWNKPTMANGANFAFSQKVFQEVGGYAGNEHIASGDDEFLLHKIINRYPGSARFNPLPQSVVATRAPATVSGFLHQRIRWAGKWKHRKDLFTNMLASMVFLFQLTFLTLPWCLLADLISWKLVAAVLGTKALAEWLFLRKAATALKITVSPLAFVTWQVLYPYYVVSIAAISGVATFRWKNREY